ncbi:MAG: HNH endonuclease signature motif containing protein [Vicinamibacterales bacterium]
MSEFAASDGGSTTPTEAGAFKVVSNFMQASFNLVSALADDDLIALVTSSAAQERHATVELIASLAEFDARRLYLAAGCSSLFTYCTQVLLLSEHAAYRRIEVARTVRHFPVVLTMLAEGSVTLTVVCLVAPLLTAENHQAILDRARHKTKREVEELLAELRPQPPVAESIRKVPSRASVVCPLAPERYTVLFTISRETYDKLQSAQALLRHVVPNGDLSLIVDRALTVLVERLEKQKAGAAAHPREGRASSDPRHIPASVRRMVWARDGGRCAFMGTEGRCTEQGFLEFHHVRPFAAGGETTADNLELRCRAHNGYESQRFFGSELVKEESRSFGLDALW